GVRPVGEIHRLAVDIQAGASGGRGAELVERVPHPDRIVILVQVNKCITKHVCGAHTPRQSCALLVMVNQQDQVSVGQGEKIVMDRVYDQVETSGTEPVIEVGGCELTDEISRQV